MAKQIIFGTASADWCAIDNSSAPVFPSLNAGTSIGYDTTAPGAGSQAVNVFADTGSVLLDTTNDTVYIDPSNATVQGNPISNTPPTFKTATTVMTGSLLGPRLLFKNPS